MSASLRKRPDGASPRMEAIRHVWTAPAVQEKDLTFPRIVRLAGASCGPRLCSFSGAMGFLNLMQVTARPEEAA